ncbi:MAG: FtsQ-type POTRA domain-containing protein [Actinobacteria bacterium]|nr:FtsQ-type POTRA domain-containing protein [Actinomycetota bacterium]
MSARLTDVTTRRPLAPVRRNWAAWVAVGVLLVLLAGGVVLHSPWLSVKEIEIAGAEQVDVAGRLEDAGIGIGAIMVWLDTGSAEEAVAADPWAASVRVSREWPDRLVIEVVERTPALWVEGTTGWMLVAGDGVVLTVADTPGTGVLTASVGLASFPAGASPGSAAWRELVAMTGALSRSLAASSTVVAEGGEWWLETPGHRVRLGHPIDLADKALVAEVMLADGLPPGSTLDVVAPRRPAVVPPTPIEALQAGVEGSGEGDAAPAVEGEGDGA